MRLAGVHASAELANIVEGKSQKPGGQPPAPPHGPDAPKEGPAPREGGRPAVPDDTPRAVPLPSAVRPYYEARRGFTNHHFNTVERDRVARMIASDGLHAAVGGRWVLKGRLATGEDFRIELSDEEGVIDLPTGTTRIDAAGELDVNPSPPGSGGMLAALVLWRRLLREGPEPLGRTSYWGTVPLDPRDLGEGGFGEADGPRLVDMLESSVAGVEARFTVGDGGTVSGIELWTAPDADPCEVGFAFAPPTHPQDLPKAIPAVIVVRHGNELFGEFRVEKAVLEKAAGEAGGGDLPATGAAALPGGGT